MTNEEYDRWSAHHGALFCFASEAEAAMMEAWQPILGGYMVAELIEASEFLASSGTVRFRTDHLPAIQRRITERRFAAEQAYLEQAADKEYGCDLCSGCGIVSVPHPKYVLDSQWRYPFPTAAVTCRCAAGSRKHQKLRECAKENRPPMMSIVDYEVRNPDWQRQLLDRENRQKDERYAHDVAGEADRRHGPMNPQDIAKRLAARFGAKRIAHKEGWNGE